MDFSDPSPIAARPRPQRLTPREFAFVRSWAEGLDLAAAWHRYLHDGAGPGDTRQARSALLPLLDGLRAQARSQGRPDIVALLRRDPESIVDRRPPPPSLDEFRDRFAPDLYGEAELLELYEAQFGAPDARSPVRRRQRLRARLVLAVQWLEHQEVRAPRRADPVGHWLDERVAARLTAVGVGTLDELMRHIGRRGFRWYRTVPRLGPVGAARIVAWLRSREASLGALPADALQPARRVDLRSVTPSPRPGIVPLERFQPPAELDGSAGRCRGAQAHCLVAAAQDLQAVQAWLGLRDPHSHTGRAYRKEAERLLLWAVIERRKALSSLDAEDGRAYAEFLAAPGPRWTAPRNTPRWSEAWRPFEAGLAPRSRARALSAARSLCDWLLQQGYLSSHPWQAAPGSTSAAPARPPSVLPAAAPAVAPGAGPVNGTGLLPPSPAGRALSLAQCRAVERWIDRQAPSPAQRRWRCLFRLASGTGLRLSELASARAQWLQHGEAGWSLRVPGPGCRMRELPVPAPVVESFRECLTDQAAAGRFPSNDPESVLQDVLQVLPTAPLLAALTGPARAEPASTDPGPRPLSAARIYEVLVDGLRRCATDLARRDPLAAGLLQRASTQWLRHAYGCQAAAQGMPRALLQARLGHGTGRAASGYLRASAEMEGFREGLLAAPVRT